MKQKKQSSVCVLIMCLCLNSSALQGASNDSQTAFMEHMKDVNAEMQKGNFDGALGMLKEDLGAQEVETPEGKTKAASLKLAIVGLYIRKGEKDLAYKELEGILEELSRNDKNYSATTIGTLPASVHLRYTAMASMALIRDEQKRSEEARSIRNDLSSYLNREGELLQRKQDAGTAISDSERKIMENLKTRIFLNRLSERVGVSTPKPTPNAMKTLQAQRFPISESVLSSLVEIPASQPLSENQVRVENSAAGNRGESCAAPLLASAPASQTAADSCGCGGDADAAPAATPAADSCCATPVPAAQ